MLQYLLRAAYVYADYCLWWRCRPTKSCADSPRRNTMVRSTTSPIYLAADLSVLLTPTVWQCIRSIWREKTCRTKWHLSKSFLWLNIFRGLNAVRSFSVGLSSSWCYLDQFENLWLNDWLIDNKGKEMFDAQHTASSWHF